MNVLDITKPGYISDAGPIETFQGGTFPGKLTLEVSRTSGVSPCTIVVSAKNTTRNSYDSHQVLGTGGTTNIGYYIDFGDPTSGTFDSYHGTSKDISLGGFMGVHTYYVADGGGSVTFTIMVRAKDASGNEALGFIDVTVQAQDDYYSAGNTIAISNTLGATGWDSAGYDRSPPTGYTEYSQLKDAGAGGNTMFWDDIAGKRIMLFRGDDFSAEGSLFVRMGNNNCHITWFGDELSGTVVNEGASTISFTTPSEADKTSGIGGTITDSNNGLGSLTVGAEITITGAAGNNSTWVVRSVAAGSVTVRYNKGNVMTTEAANGSAVITEHNLLPEIDQINLGTPESEASGLITDADLTSSKSDFSNDGWIENFYIDGIRTPEIDLIVTGKHTTMHRCDLDYEDSVGDSTSKGWISLHNPNYVWNNVADLDPATVPFPHGVYISECTIIGCNADAIANKLPSINISGVNYAFPTWLGIVGTRIRSSGEHNIRIQGYQNAILHELDVLGQHLGGAGGKSRVTMRGAGGNIRAEIDWDTTTLGDYATSEVVLSSTNWKLPRSQWCVGQYIFDSGSSTGDSTFSGIEIADELELHRDGILLHWTIDATATQRPNSVQLITENAQNICYTSITGLVNTGTLVDNTSVLDDGPNNVITDGVQSTLANYLGPTYLDGPGASAYNLPVPTAPR